MNYYYIIGIIAFIITTLAQIFVSVNYNKYKNVLNKNKMSGYDTAKKILDNNGLSSLYIVETKGYLTDHYDPSAKVIRLSTDNYHGETIAGAAIAAHEAGHAIQHKEGNLLIKLRKFIFPIVNFSTKAGYYIILFGFIFGILKLVYLGIALLSFIVLFQLITLPVEIDASKKALNNIKKLNILDKDELNGASKVLRAAAFTYVAGLASAILEVFRLILMAKDND